MRIQEGQISADPEHACKRLNCEGSAGEGEKSLGGRRGSGKELLALSAGTASTPAKARWDFTLLSRIADPDPHYVWKLDPDSHIQVKI